MLTAMQQIVHQADAEWTHAARTYSEIILQMCQMNAQISTAALQIHAQELPTAKQTMTMTVMAQIAAIAMTLMQMCIQEWPDSMKACKDYAMEWMMTAMKK